MEERSGLLIAALVAIVSVVGLVILFKGAATGNQTIVIGETPTYRAPDATVENPAHYRASSALGEEVAQECNTLNKDRGQCCSVTCGVKCGPDDLCWRACLKSCKEAIHEPLTEHSSLYRRN